MTAERIAEHPRTASRGWFAKGIHFSVSSFSTSYAYRSRSTAALEESTLVRAMRAGVTRLVGFRIVHAKGNIVVREVEWKFSCNCFACVRAHVMTSLVPGVPDLEA